MLAQMCNDFIAQRWLLFVVASASAHDFPLLLINNVFYLSYTGRPSLSVAPTTRSPIRKQPTALPTSMAATSRTPSKSPTLTPTGF